MTYWIQINKWFGDEMKESNRFNTIKDAESAVKERFGDIEWADTPMGFHVTDSEDWDMVFAKGGPELWEISMFSEDGIEDWDEELLK